MGSVGFAAQSANRALTLVFSELVGNTIRTHFVHTPYLPKGPLSRAGQMNRATGVLCYRGVKACN